MFKKDNNLWRAPIEPENSAQEELLMNAYREIYKQYRYTDHSADASKDLALSDLKRSWGLSNAFVGPTQAARFMQNPPDKYYGQPILGMKPFEDQAREVVGQELARRYSTETKSLKEYGDISGTLGGYDASKIEVQVLPARTTNDDVRSGSSAPRYQVAYRDPRSGAVSIADDNWQPNKDRIEQEEREAMAEQKAAAVRKRKVLEAAAAGYADLPAAGAGLP